MSLGSDMTGTIRFTHLDRSPAAALLPPVWFAIDVRISRSAGTHCRPLFDGFGSGFHSPSLAEWFLWAGLCCWWRSCPGPDLRSRWQLSRTPLSWPARPEGKRKRLVDGFPSKGGCACVRLLIRNVADRRKGIQKSCERKVADRDRVVG